MATGASTANLAILLVDARHSLQEQTHRHAYICNMLGIRNFVLAINKMDLVDFSKDRFETIKQEFDKFISQYPSLSQATVQTIPISALAGDNITSNSDKMGWYQDKPLLPYLETVETSSQQNNHGFRMPVQWVNRPNLDFRGYSGRIASQHIAVDDDVTVLPNGLKSKVAKIITMDTDGTSLELSTAQKGQSVTLVLKDEIDISRGDIICNTQQTSEISDQFLTTILWMDQSPLLPARQYFMKIGTKTITATITNLENKFNLQTHGEDPAKTLTLNDIGTCKISLDTPIAYDPYDNVQEMGGFILIDRISHHTVGMGMIKYGLKRADNIHWQDTDIDKARNATQKNQTPVLLWFTGLSGSGKSTIANAVQRKLYGIGAHSYLLDGDNIRHGLNRDLGFTDQDRVENIRRVAEVSKLMIDAGLITLVSFISPFSAERQQARNLVEENEFIEIFIDTPLEEAEKRDPKGLYKKVRAGELYNFTGVDSPYEAPENPEIRIDTLQKTPTEAADEICAILQKRGFIQ